MARPRMDIPAHPFMISVMSRDRIGIVYQVSSAVNALGGNIADLRQSVLRGYFAMILLAFFPSEVTRDLIRSRLSALRVGDGPALEVGVQEAPDATVADGAGALQEAYVLTASAEDRLGLVATISAFCAENDINILDLSTAIQEGTYTMILLVDLSRCPDVGDIRRKLRRFGDETGLAVVLQHYDIFRVTNEVSLR